MKEVCRNDDTVSNVYGGEAFLPHKSVCAVSADTKQTLNIAYRVRCGIGSAVRNMTHDNTSFPLARIQLAVKVDRFPSKTDGGRHRPRDFLPLVDFTKPPSLRATLSTLLL
jgi:hypothetical protein